MTDARPTQRPYKAIAAMAANRVIGAGNRIPWHLPDDFKWFKRATTGHVVVMGRRTFESIGKPLPNRDTIVLSRSGFAHPGARTIASLDELPALTAGREVFICGGAELYRLALPLCSELFLTHIHRSVEGDTFFPPFEDDFESAGVVLEHPDFTVEHYRRRNRNVIQTLTDRVELEKFDSAELLVATVANRWIERLARRAVGAAPFTVALPGGRIARDLFSAAARSASERGVSFGDVEFFWGDERCVPPDDRESNYRAAHEGLLAPIGVPGTRIHRIRGELEPEVAAREAAAELVRVAPVEAAGRPVLDLVFLGMGEDGHVASLFPGESDAVMDSREIYRAVTASKPPPRRITLGYGVLAAAREVWVLASGAGKESALRESLKPTGTTPLARLIRLRERTTVFTDIA